MCGVYDRCVPIMFSSKDSTDALARASQLTEVSRGVWGVCMVGVCKAVSRKEIFFSVLGHIPYVQGVGRDMCVWG